MNPIDCVNYYLSNKTEFCGENGHTVLVNIIKNKIPHTNNSNVIGIDIGACIGNYIKNIRDICTEDNSIILAFEPNPLNLPLLENNIKDYHNVVLHKCCVSDISNSNVSF
jgi:hypothetical protein